MANLEYCFFCCEYVSEETSDVPRVKLEGDNSLHCDLNFTSEPVDCNKVVQENVLRISHYLKVPRRIINKNKGATLKIKTCQSCTEICSILSDYCLQLEIVQMKISHYLALLTGRITGTSGQNCVEQTDQFRMSNFQKLVHQKCFLNVQNAGKTITPQIHLRKCANPSQQPRQDIKMEEISENPEIPEEMELANQVKIEEYPTTSTIFTDDQITDELQSCPFCTFIVNGPYEELHSHINIVHPEHFKTDQDGTFSTTRDNSGDVLKEEHCLAVNEQQDCGPFRCKKCGKTFTVESNLIRHLRTSNVCARGFREQSSNRGNFECSNCKRRYSRKDYLKYHIRSVCKKGIIIEHETGRNAINLLNSTSKDIRKHKFTKCEYCGTLVHQRNLKRHVNLKHKNGNIGNEKGNRKMCEICSVPCGNQRNLKNHMLIEHGIKLQEKLKKFRCEMCNKCFELRRSLRRHLEKSAKCKSGICEEGEVMVGNQVVNKQEEEPVLFVSIPKPNYDTDIVTDGVQGNIEEDPLKI